MASHIYGGNGFGECIIAEADTRERARRAYHELAYRKQREKNEDPDSWGTTEVVRVTDSGGLVVERA